MVSIANQWQCVCVRVRVCTRMCARVCVCVQCRVRTTTLP